MRLDEFSTLWPAYLLVKCRWRPSVAASETNYDTNRNNGRQNRLDDLERIHHLTDFPSSMIMRVPVCRSVIDAVPTIAHGTVRSFSGEIRSFSDQDLPWLRLPQDTKCHSDLTD